jgi:hypothetical protein
MAGEKMTLEQWQRAIGLAEAAKSMRPGRNGRPPTPKTLRAYADPDRGYRPLGWNGPPVVLMTVRVGQYICTLPEWVERFERERAEVGTMLRVRVKVENSRSRKASIRRANEYLDRVKAV